MNIQDVLRAILTTTFFTDEHLLGDEAHRVCDLDLWRDSVSLKVNRPRVNKENLKVAQTLRSDARNLHCCFAPALAIVVTANQGRQELDVKTRRFITKMVVRCRWPVVTHKLFQKAVRQQSYTDVFFSDREYGGHDDVSIQRAQGRVVHLLCLWVLSIELMRPASDDYYLIKPWFKCSKEPPESLGILTTIHSLSPEQRLKHSTLNLSCLFATSCRVRGDVKPHLQHIGDWDLFAHHHSTENSFWMGWYSDNHISGAVGLVDR